MYNPYRQRGEWIDCGVCGSAHRRILQTDLIDYINSDGTDIKLSEEESTRCYKCEPITLYYSFTCNSCTKHSILETKYDSKHPSVCPECKHDNNTIDTSSHLAFIESRPKLDSDMKYMLNRIKKNHYNSTMPDY